MLINERITAANTSKIGAAVGYPKFHKITPINQNNVNIEKKQDLAITSLRPTSIKAIRI